MEKFVTSCALPTDHEREILVILIEECAEVIHRATKILRFGRDEIQPEQPHTNRERLSIELGDLKAVVAMAANAGLLDLCIVDEFAIRKRDKLERFMQTEPKP